MKEGDPELHFASDLEQTLLYRGGPRHQASKSGLWGWKNRELTLCSWLKRRHLPAFCSAQRQPDIPQAACLGAANAATTSRARPIVSSVSLRPQGDLGQDLAVGWFLPAPRLNHIYEERSDERSRVTKVSDLRELSGCSLS